MLPSWRLNNGTTTSGHSFRVADGTLSLARRVERLERGLWAGARFSAEDLRELRYAALLHDFGKVAVRENVLTKALKLFDEELVTLRGRFMLAVPHIAPGASRAGCRKPCMILRGCVSVYHSWRLTWSGSWPILRLCSRSCSTPTSQTSSRRETTQRSKRSVSENLWILMGSVSLLTDREVQMLSLRRGNLTSHERQEIEKHVTHSFNFLWTIPWTKDLARVPDLAGRHHEKLDGSGYPQGLSTNDIPIGTRMMTIADIYDALVARDRPYKKALSLEGALSILEAEAKAGQLDASLVQLWIEAKAWEDIGTILNSRGKPCACP